jgi:NAD(P)-dependent dehydrogenase (short-subunit alcohol dehydrogenase family)
MGDSSALDEPVRVGPGANLHRRVSTAKDVAELIVYLSSSSNSHQITAQTIHASSGLVV